MFEVKQLSVGGFDHNFSYVISSGNDLLIADPCGDVSLIFQTVASFPRQQVRYILITHHHPDHIDGLAEVSERFPDAVIAGHPLCRPPGIMELQDREKLPFGESFIECFYTPGHAPTSICYLTGDHSALLTGDTLFIGCCGFCRPGPMFHTMHDILYHLPDEAKVYSGHDYGAKPFDTLGQQKKENPFLAVRDFPSFKEEVRKLI